MSKSWANVPATSSAYSRSVRPLHLWGAERGEVLGGGPVGHNIDDAMRPYTHIGMTVTPRMMLSSRELDYAYDTAL